MPSHARALSAPLIVLGLAACGTTVTDGSGGGQGTGGATTTSTSTSTDPCAGKSCGDPCSTCPPGAPCQQEACDANGACVGAEGIVCGGCPTTAPADQAACSPAGLVCELDDGPIVECRARATCTATGWLNEAPGCSSTLPPDPSCPATMPTGPCDIATDPGLCGYGDVLCGCSDCLGGPCGGQAAWVCGQAPAAPCPAVAPKLGLACTDPDLTCLYGSCSLGAGLAGRRCAAGVWVDEIVACPL